MTTLERLMSAVKSDLSNRIGILQTGPVTRDDVRDMEMRRFDLTLSDGRVFRVRVSDITPIEGG